MTFVSKRQATGWRQRLRNRTNVLSTAIHEAGHAVMAGGDGGAPRPGFRSLRRPPSGLP